MLEPLAIKISNITKPKTTESIYIINRQQDSLERFVVIYSTIGPREEVLAINKNEISFRQIIEILKRGKVPYQEIFTLDNNFLKKVESEYRKLNQCLFSLVVAFLLLIESKERPTIVTHERLNYLVSLSSYGETEKWAIDPKFLKSILLSASRINFCYLQLLSIFYDTIWNDILQIQDFASLFTKEEATQIFNKVFVPKFSEDKIMVTPGWVKLLCMAKEIDIVYKKFFNKVREVIVSTSSLREARTSADTHECEKVFRKLLHEKKPKVFVTGKSYRPLPSIIHSAFPKGLLETDNDFTLTILLLIMTNCIEKFHESLQMQGCSIPPLKVIQFNMKQETFEFFLTELKTLIKNYFSLSPFMILLFYSIPYMILSSPYRGKESLGKIFFHHFNDLLLSVSDKLLKEQRFKRIVDINNPILAMLLLATPDVNLIENLTEKCLKIKNFPLEVFLFYPEIRKCKTYEKLILKVAKSERRVIDYIEALKIIESKEEVSDLPSLPQKYKQEYELIYSDIKKNIPMNVIKRVLQRKYTIDGIEDKIKVLAITSKEDRTSFKRHLMLKEMGLHKGSIPEIIDTIFKIHKVSSLYDFIKFIGRTTRKMNNNELEIFAQMLSCFVGITGSYVYVASRSSKSLLENLNINHAISMLRKVKEAAKK